MVDFGKSFGTSALIVKRPGDGHVENLDFEYIFKSLPAFGLWRRPYEGTANPGIQGLGMFDAEHFRPDIWKSHAPYRPFDFADKYDMYWAAKIVMRFTPEQIRVALEQGRFEDSRAVEYLVKVLVERQKKSGRFAFSQVNPLDNFEVIQGDDGQSYNLCFDDLLVSYELDPAAGSQTSYKARSFDFEGKELGWNVDARSGQNHIACVEGFAPGSARDNYTIIRLETQRGGEALDPVEVHLATDPQVNQLRVIGVDRR